MGKEPLLSVCNTWARNLVDLWNANLNAIWAQCPGQVIPTSQSKTLLMGDAPYLEGKIPHFYIHYIGNTPTMSTILNAIWASHPGQDIPT